MFHFTPSTHPRVVILKLRFTQQVLNLHHVKVEDFVELFAKLYNSRLIEVLFRE